jgi:hypothetical protein
MPNATGDNDEAMDDRRRGDEGIGRREGAARTDTGASIHLSPRFRDDAIDIENSSCEPTLEVR